MKIKIIDESNLTPDNSVAVPNDLVDKYMRLFNKKQFIAVMDLIQQTYRAGLKIGRDETKFYRG